VNPNRRQQSDLAGRRTRSRTCEPGGIRSEAWPTAGGPWRGDPAGPPRGIERAGQRLSDVRVQAHRSRHRAGDGTAEKTRSLSTTTEIDKTGTARRPPREGAAERLHAGRTARRSTNDQEARQRQHEPLQPASTGNQIGTGTRLSRSKWTSTKYERTGVRQRVRGEVPRRRRGHQHAGASPGHGGALLAGHHGCRAKP